MDIEYNVSLHFQVLYEIANMQYGNHINISFNFLEEPKNEYDFAFGFLEQNSCYGGNPALNATCFTVFQNKFGDLQGEFIFDFYQYKTPPRYNGVIVGELIKRNGIFLKNNNQPYTSKDPCWTHSSGIPFTSAFYNSTFCCTKFSKVSASFTTVATTPTAPPTTSTTSPSPNSESNIIGTPCLNEDFIKNWLDTLFVVDTSNAMTRTGLKEMAAEIVTDMNGFTFRQNGNYFRTAIIYYATGVQIYYQLSESTTLEAFADHMFSLSNFLDPNDGGGNVQG